MEYNKLKPFKFWCQQILPTVFDDSMSYYEVLSKLTWYVNELIQNTDVLKLNIDELKNLYVQLKNYVDNYFNNLDLTQEINNKLDEMATDGTLERIINNRIFKQFSKVVSLGLVSPWAQIKAPDGFQLQSSCVDNNSIYSIFLDTDNVNLYLCVYNLQTGQKTSDVTFTNYNSHANDLEIVDDYIIIVNSSGSKVDYITKIDTYNITTYTLIPIQTHYTQITKVTSTDVYCGFNNQYIYKVNPNNFSVEEQYYLPSNTSDFISQSMQYHEGNFYIVGYSYDQGVPQNVLFRCYLDDTNIIPAALLRNQYILPGTIECESVIEYLGRLYACYRGSYINTICELVTEPSLKKLPITNFVDNGITRLSNKYVVYCDNTYNGFFTDGSEEHPYLNYNTLQPFLPGSYYSLELHIAGNTISNMSIFNSKQRLNIILNTTINNVNIFNCDSVVFEGGSVKNFHVYRSNATFAKTNINNQGEDNAIIEDSTVRINGEDSNLINVNGTFNCIRSNVSLAYCNFNGNVQLFKGYGSFINVSYPTSNVNAFTVNAEGYHLNNLTNVIAITNYNGSVPYTCINGKFNYTSTCNLTGLPAGVQAPVIITNEKLSNTNRFVQTLEPAGTSGYYMYRRYIDASNTGAWNQIF